MLEREIIDITAQQQKMVRDMINIAKVELEKLRGEIYAETIYHCCFDPMTGEILWYL